jgi:hypothetical protein
MHKIYIHCCFGDDSRIISSSLCCFIERGRDVLTIDRGRGGWLARVGEGTWN